MDKNINVVSSSGGSTGSWKARLPGGTHITTMPKKLYDAALKRGGKELARSSRDGRFAGAILPASDVKPK